MEIQDFNMEIFRLMIKIDICKELYGYQEIITYKLNMFIYILCAKLMLIILPDCRNYYTVQTHGF